MEKAHRRVGESYLGGHYSSYKQPLREARRAFCCGNWLNGLPKQTIPLEIYVYLRSLPISSMRATIQAGMPRVSCYSAYIKSNPRLTILVDRITDAGGQMHRKLKWK